MYEGSCGVVGNIIGHELAGSSWLPVQTLQLARQQHNVVGWELLGCHSLNSSGLNKAGVNSPLCI